MRSSRIITGIVILILFSTPLIAAAQTSAPPNTSLIAALTQLVQILEQELQQLIKQHAASAVTNTPTQCPITPQPSTSCTGMWSAITDANGCTTAWQCSVALPSYTNSTPPTTVTIPVQTSNVTFTASPTSGTAPLSVTFNASELTIGGSYTVNFGDGTSGQLTVVTSFCPVGVSSCLPVGSVSHAYQSSGTYSATLTNSSGGTLAVATITVTSSTQQGECSESTNNGQTWQEVPCVTPQPIPF